jgi:hypothetical protein
MVLTCLLRVDLATPLAVCPVHSPVGLPPIALGIGALFFYRSRLQAREQAATEAVRDDQPGQPS